MNNICTLCSAPFEITKDDLACYEKISPVIAGKTYLIPPPTRCPDCRNRRRMSWRNDRCFYKRKCDLTGENFLSIFPSDSPYVVYKPSAWYSDKWDPTECGRPFDFTRPFFEQFEELMRVVPQIGIDVINCENSEYCNYCGDDKNCYLDIAGEGNEDCYFNLFIKHCTNCTDCTFCYHCTLCYECINCYTSYSCLFSQYLENCTDCIGCFDCKGCKDCAFSINLRGKQYQIFNVQYDKAEYERRVQEMRLGTFGGWQAAWEKWQTFRIEKGMYRDMYTLNCENCSGNDIQNSKNCSGAFNVVNCEDSSYLNDVLDARDCRDLNYSLYKPECSYELCSTLALTFSAFNMASHYSSNIFYCQKVNHCKNLFGCIGFALGQKQYCILNKQYTKEEYEALVPKIIEHMRATGEYGEFFPETISQYAYNETVAQEYYPLSKDEVIERGWKWREQVDEMPKVEKVIEASQLPETIIDIPDDILNWAIRCEVTGRPFRIIRQELEFYRNLQLPIPHVHPDERHKRRMMRRNPRSLWDRQCAKCQKAIRTTYSPERPETVYLDECYLKEVY